MLANLTETPMSLNEEEKEEDFENNLSKQGLSTKVASDKGDSPNLNTKIDACIFKKSLDEIKNNRDSTRYEEYNESLKLAFEVILSK